jgi:hypothetical protein
MLLAGTPLAASKARWQRGAVCERRDRQQDGPNALGWAAREERAATSVRRVGGEATLRRRRGLLVVARSSPCGAARGDVTLAMNQLPGVRDARDNLGNLPRGYKSLAQSA